jgi:hypothetical protein
MDKRCDKHYVSEFTRFIDHYLADHPEVVKDQKRGWNIHWDHKVDFQSLKEAGEDTVPDDSYGFHSVVQHKDRS